MREQPPITRILTVTDARGQFGQILDQAGRHEARVLVAEDDNPIAAIVSAEDLRRLEEWDARRAECARMLERMREPFKDIPPEQIERDVAAVIAEVRAEDETDKGTKNRRSA